MTQAGGDALTRLFRPRSVAIVGASDDPARISGKPLRFLKEGGFDGPIYPVNPRRRIVQGLRSYPSIDALPEVPDVALVALPAAMVAGAIEAAAGRGIRAACIFSAGFSETGPAGAAAERAILETARAAGMRVLGPNCLGAFASSIGYFGMFATSFDRGLPEPGPVAIVSQSGAHGQHLAYLARRRGLGVGYCISTGNEMDVDAAEALAWVLERADVSVATLYCEGVRDGDRLVAALARAHELRKPVVVMKAGRSAAGARAVGSHTSALAGEDAVMDGILAQYGAVRAASTEEQIDFTYAFARGGRPSGPRVGIVSVSGGGGVQLADHCEAAGLEVPPPRPETAARLAGKLPGARAQNPLDVTGQVVNDPGLLQGALAAIAADRFDALVVFLTTVALDRGAAHGLAEAIRDGVDPARTPVVLCMVADEDTVREHERRGFMVFEDPRRAVAALAALVRYAPAGRKPADVPAETARAEVLARDAFDEVGAKRILSAAGIASPREVLAGSAEDAVAAAEGVGFPVAMKIVSPDIAHKTEIGGVLLDVRDAEAVRTGHARLLERARTAAPGARLSGILVAAMAPSGIETVVGSTIDAAFGPVVMFGLGGTLVEIFGEIAFRRAPVDDRQARAMIAATRAERLLAGVRGGPAADVDALARAIVAVSRLAADNRRRIAGIEINPLRVLPVGEGVLALDAHVVPASVPERKAS